MANTISTLLWGIHYGDLRNWLLCRVAGALFGLVLATLSYRIGQVRLQSV